MKLCPRCEEAYTDDASFCPFDAEPLKRSTDPLLGRTLAGRYRLVRRLGTGGMSHVYLARHVMIDRRSAIKILRQDLGINPANRERFLREARAVNRINHPNIVEITDLGEDGPLVFLVMEYVQGESLMSAIERGPLPARRVVRIALQIASALARAHELGVIHRDLKPDNVLLYMRDRGELVKLIDFGIAKIVDAPALTFSEQRFGTPGYIAPEYIEGLPASPRGDLYALGIVLYEMLTATLPFDARFPAELLALATQGKPVNVRARVPTVPFDLGALVMSLISREPDKRPRDAFVVLDRLNEIWKSVGGGSDRPHARDSVLPPAPASSAIPNRWRASLSELEMRVEDARQVWGGSDPRVLRARELVDAAVGLHGPLQRAGAAASDHQGEVDGLQARAREFKADLGRAIETLSRDRSRERARIDQIGLERLQAEEDMRSDAAVSSDAAARLGVLAQEDRARRAVEADLTFQIEELQRQLVVQNESLETELIAATGRLEGAIAAARRITQEIARAREEAMKALG